MIRLAQPVVLWWPAGVVKQTLMFDDAQGQPLLLDTNNEYLAVLTSTAQVRVFRLAGREAKPHAGPGKVAGSPHEQPHHISCMWPACFLLYSICIDT
jgi:hypothetical protein